MVKFEIIFFINENIILGLTKAGFTNPTDIQREAIGVALKGHDILGAAMTGSGKTLAFLIPVCDIFLYKTNHLRVIIKVLECLYRTRWTMNDGLGILIISPTRELAYQTFEVLKKVGQFHDFSAGLIIGGKVNNDYCSPTKPAISFFNIRIIGFKS
jgi:ATP-dependent RNA helicase DDX10/DBP4